MTTTPLGEQAFKCFGISISVIKSLLSVRDLLLRNAAGLRDYHHKTPLQLPRS